MCTHVKNYFPLFLGNIGVGDSVKMLNKWHKDVRAVVLT